jgi:DNA-binding transcriptional LysR family regulator
MGDTFDPATCATRFKVATSDYTQFLLMPALAKVMASEAPSASIDVLPVNILHVEEALDFGEIDVAVANIPEPPPSLKRCPLFRERYVGIAATEHGALRPGLTAKAFGTCR